MAEHWCPEHGLHGDWHPGADGAYCAWEDGSGTCGQYPIAPTVVQAIEAAAHVRAWDLAAWMIMPNGESSSAEVAKATRDKDLAAARREALREAADHVPRPELLTPEIVASWLRSLADTQRDTKPENPG